MFYLPVDLFSPYIKGREYAIDRNWNDLNQSNQVERGWLDNDRRQLDNWFAQDTYGDKIATSNANARINQNAAQGSDYDIQVAGAMQPGRVARAASQSDYVLKESDAMRGLLDVIAQNQATANLGQSVANAAQGRASMNYADQTFDSRARTGLATDAFNRQQMANQQQQYDMNLPLLQLNNDVRTQQLQYLRDNPELLVPPRATQPAGNGALFQGPAGSTTQTNTDVLTVQNTLNRYPPGSEGQIDYNGTKLIGGRNTDGSFYIRANGNKIPLETFFSQQPVATGNAPQQGSILPGYLTGNATFGW